jgi:type I restriction enzyme S subunit
MNQDRKEKGNVPNLRFPGFEEEWEKYKISDILELFPTNSLSWEQLEYETDNIYNLHYGLIHKGLPTQIDLEKCTLPNIKVEFIPNNCTICKEGDIAFADASEDTNDVAKAVEFYKCNNKKIVCGLHTIHGRDKLELTITGFKGYAFSASVFRHQIRKLAQGTKIFSVSAKNFSELYIGIPSKKEQLKIAHLLLLIDQRIETQIKIIEQYKSLIKGVSKKIFSQKLRFQDQNGNNFSDWEERKFDEVLVSLSVRKYQIKNSEYYSTGKYNVVDQGQELIAGYSDSDKNIFYDFPVIVFGDHTTIIKYIDFAFIVGADGTKLLRSKNKENLKYLYYNLRYNNVQQEGYKRHFTILSRIYLQIPSLKEQTQIAEFLSSIDTKIQTEKKLLKEYQRQKQHFLQNLFI